MIFIIKHFNFLFFVQQERMHRSKFPLGGQGAYISYLLSLRYKAVRVNPSSLAALVIFPLCFSITLRIVFFSMALNFNSAGSCSDTDGISMGEKIRSFACRTFSSAMITARSMVY